MNSEDEVGTAFAVDLGAASHQGHVRENNEDHYLLMEFGRSLNNLKTNLDKHILEPSHTSTGYGMFVADGIGSMAGAKWRAAGPSPSSWNSSWKRQTGS